MSEFLKNPTIHESFSLMLMERIENLEKENQQLLNTIKDLKTDMKYYQKYHYFKFTVLFETSFILYIDNTVKKYINSIMSKRTIFKPSFLLWNYTITDIFDMISESEQDKINNRYSVYITAYLITEEPVSLYDMTHYVNDSSIKIDYLIGGLYELKSIVIEKVGYQVLLPYLNENDRIEIWTKGGLFEHETNPIMNEDAFTLSDNYIKSESLQEEYFRMIHMGSWSELFSIYHRY